jgi:hypothetical protein
MTPQQAHRDLALKILVGRALALTKGLPWTLDEDREMIIRERTLWAALSPEAQNEEQAELARLWGRRGSERKVTINPHWGEWARALGSEATIPDAAFGLPTSGFRPHSRGVDVMMREHPQLEGVLSLLWQSGFQPAAVTNDTVLLPIPAHRIVQESERLVGMLGRNFPTMMLQPFGTGSGVQVQGTYDPATGQASLSVHGADQLI